jgi:hypothetical protein
MAVNVCWTFGYGNREDYDLADRWDSHEVYMNPRAVVEKLKEIFANTKQELAEHPDYFVDKVWFGAEIDNVEELVATCKPKSTRLIYMDKYRGEWLSCREIKW